MNLKRMLLPAAVVAMIALLAPCANAQTMGEYASTTAGVGTGSGSMGSSFSLPSFASNGGGSSGTWGASRLGSSFEERAAAVSGSGMGQSFESRAAALTSAHASESRWPGTGISSGTSENRFATGDRFSTGDRFTANGRFSSTENRWPGSAFKDHMGLDTNYNSVSGN